jgi:hypothetical protein
MQEFSLSIDKKLKDLRIKYPVLHEIIEDVIHNEDIADASLLIHISLVFEYLHIVFIPSIGKTSSISAILQVEDIYETLGERGKDLAHEFSNLVQHPIVIMTQPISTLN